MGLQAKRRCKARIYCRGITSTLCSPWKEGDDGTERVLPAGACQRAGRQAHNIYWQGRRTREAIGQGQQLLFQVERVHCHTCVYGPSLTRFVSGYRQAHTVDERTGDAGAQRAPHLAVEGDGALQRVYVGGLDVGLLGQVVGLRVLRRSQMAQGCA